MAYTLEGSRYGTGQRYTVSEGSANINRRRSSGGGSSGGGSSGGGGQSRATEAQLEASRQAAAEAAALAAAKLEAERLAKIEAERQQAVVDRLKKDLLVGKISGDQSRKYALQQGIDRIKDFNTAKLFVNEDNKPQYVEYRGKSYSPGVFSAMTGYDVATGKAILELRTGNDNKVVSFIKRTFGRLPGRDQNTIINITKFPERLANESAENLADIRKRIGNAYGSKGLKVFDAITKVNPVAKKLVGYSTAAGDYLIRASEANMKFSRNLKREQFGILKDDYKVTQFLLGANAEVGRIIGGFLKLPAVVVAIYENPAIIPMLTVGILTGVASDLKRIINAPFSGDITSMGSAFVGSLFYILPAIQGGRAIINKIKMKNAARLTKAEIGRIKYAARKALKTVEKTIKQKGVITKISGRGTSRTTTGSLSNVKYKGVMRLSKKDATVLQTSSVKLKNGASYNSISEVTMKFGQKQLPYTRRINKLLVETRINGKLVKLPFSKIKYTSREIISWIKDSKGRVSANIFGQTKNFKNTKAFMSYIKTRHGVKVARGLYSNPKIKNIPTSRGTSYALQRKVYDKDIRGYNVKAYKTARGNVRSKLFRRKAGGVSIQISKPTKVKNYGKRITLPKNKRTPFSKTFGSSSSGGQIVKQVSRTKTVSSIAPKISTNAFNKLLSTNKAARLVQKSLVRGAKLSLLGTALVARKASGQVTSIPSVSRMNPRQLNKQIIKIKQQIIPRARQVNRQVSRQVSRQLNRQMPASQTRQINRQVVRQVSRQKTRQMTRQLQRQLQRQITRQPGKSIPIVIRPKTEPPIIPFNLEGKFSSRTLSKSVPVYYVKIKVRGRAVNLTPRPLTMKDAKDFLAYRVDNGLSRSAWFEPMGKAKRVIGLPGNIKGYFARNSRKLRPYRFKMGRKIGIRMGYIEKRKYFNDRPGERVAARRLRRSSPSPQRRRISLQQRRILLKRLKLARAVRMRNLRRRR